MVRVVGLGSALLDRLATVSEDFLQTVPGAKGGMELIDAAQCQALLSRLGDATATAPGGSAANTVVALAHLGVPARLIAKTGADGAGDLYRSHALAAGVEPDAFKVTKEAPTGTCISLITPDSERTLRTLLGAAAALDPAEIGAADFAGCTHLHAEGYMLFNPGLLRHCLNLARDSGCSIGIDLASPEVVRSGGDSLPGLLRQFAEVVYANEAEAEAFAGTDDPEAALHCLSECCPVSVVKLGAEGALIRMAGRTVHVPAQRVKAVDTTGAGDLWAAGFLYGYLSGCGPEVAGRMGAAVAAAVVQVTGASLPLTSWTRLRRDLEALRQPSIGA